MNVTTITMPKEEAKAKLKAYKAQNKKRIDEEYQAAEKGYAALAEGTALIGLSEAMRNAPLDSQGRPRLAIARADRQQVHYSKRGDIAMFDASTNGIQHTENGLAVAVEIPAAKSWVSGFALVPMVPADVRERITGPLGDYFIFWEVEQWADRCIGSRPDRDPYLLRHIGGDLYAVIAEWDLTELERLVMAGRRDQ